LEAGRLIAVDPGRSSGIAAIDGQAVVRADRVRSTAGDPWPKLQAIRAGLRALGLSLTDGGRLESLACVGFVTEAQYLGRNPQSMLSVSESATAWEVCARLIGCEVREREHPASWQAAFGLNRKGGTKAWRKQRMRQIIDAAAQGIPDQDDVHCAILLGVVSQMRAAGWGGDYATTCGEFAWVAEVREHSRRLT
jgi:hypothetical protein